MRRVISDSVSQVKRQVKADLKADPFLSYILLYSFILAGFWIWHRVPNFATRDERWRIIDSMEAVGFFAADPSIKSLKKGVLYGKSFGATFYLYGFVFLPIFIYAFITGQLDVFSAIPNLRSDNLLILWNQTPRWVWTSSILLARFVNVILAVGCVYVMYRIGTTMRDRATGRLAAILLTISWGFVVLAHEAGEDIPALFFLLLVFYFALQYVKTGKEKIFYLGCVCGGVAITFKLTASISILLLGVAYLLRARRPDTSLRAELMRPQLLLIGAFLGFVTIYVGYPSVLVGGIETLTNWILLKSNNKGSTFGWRVKPSWWWILRGYLNGFGLPLFIGVITAALASISQLRERSLATDGIILSLVGITTVLVVLSRWAYLRTHHLLPTFPLLILILAVMLMRLYDSNRSLARPLLLFLIVTSGLYASVGDLGYASQPRDNATKWLASHASENSTVEIYVSDPQEAAIPHGMAVDWPYDREMKINGKNRTPSYTRWILLMPKRCPTYIELSYNTGVLYLASDNHSEHARRLSDPRLTKYYRDLLAENKYPYNITRTFGPQPRFLKTQIPRSQWWELLRVGLFPRTIQYGDPQDFGVDQYIVILKRTGGCNVSR
ncbi:ArnT family glycosyltransferase [Haladaptatus sp. CMAA 1911]|uniref:ArnT family glycosyltransferase n=1 Tax=unclassified Haladaptatus TaxID=2622732 RepID=UPI003754F631